MPKAIEVFNVNNRLLFIPNCKSRTIYHECIFGYATPTFRLISKDCHHEVKKYYYDLFHCLGFKFENSTSLRSLWRYLAMFALILQKAFVKMRELATTVIIIKKSRISS